MKISMQIDHPEIVIPKKRLLVSKAFRECIKDYIMYPRGEGGYQSLHIVIKMKNDVTVEFQIRTFCNGCICRRR